MGADWLTTDGGEPTPRDGRGGSLLALPSRLAAMLSYCVDPAILPSMDRGLLTSPAFAPAFGHPVRLFGCVPPSQPAYSPLTCPGDVYYCRGSELPPGNNYHPGFMRRVEGRYLCADMTRRFPWSGPDVVLPPTSPVNDDKYKTG